jgi:hypothetical protein
MPNFNAPRGFTPVRHKDGSPYNGQHEIFFIPSSDATAVFVGDVVKHAGTAGTVGVFVNGVDCEGIPAVTRATVGTTGQDIVGVVTGFYVNQSSLITRHRLASTAALVMVSTDPTVVYEVQEDALVTPLAAVDVGLNIAYVLTAGSAVTGQSAMVLDSDTKAVTITLPWKILGLAKRPDNAFNTGGAGTDQAKFEVMLNTQIFATNTLGV